MHADMIRDHHDYGFDVQGVSFDWARLKQRRDAYLQRLNGIYDRNLQSSKVDRITGFAKFLDSTHLEVDGEVYSAPHIVVATGSYSFASG